MNQPPAADYLAEFKDEFPEIAGIFSLVVKSEIEHLKGIGNGGVQVKDEDEYPEFFIACQTASNTFH